MSFSLDSGMHAIVCGNATRTDYPRSETIHSLFEHYAGATPDAIALQWDGSAFSYEELDRRASRLSGHLHRLGVRRGTLVGLCLDRSPELVVGLLGILKAGGAYVPLDPVYPDERLAFMLKDTGAPVVLLHQATASRMRPGLDRTGAVGFDVDDANAVPDVLGPACEASADDLAYVDFSRVVAEVAAELSRDIVLAALAHGLD